MFEFGLLRLPLPAPSNRFDHRRRRVLRSRSFPSCRSRRRGSSFARWHPSRTNDAMQLENRHRTPRLPEESPRPSILLPMHLPPSSDTDYAILETIPRGYHSSDLPPTAPSSSKRRCHPQPRHDNFQQRHRHHHLILPCIPSRKGACPIPPATSPRVGTRSWVCEHRPVRCSRPPWRVRRTFPMSSFAIVVRLHQRGHGYSFPLPQWTHSRYHQQHHHHNLSLLCYPK
mmetsp:Transcript_10113/g.18150  ORF Transcript_10113/g.18150 Transcript_10113/m.18150 type:complete len:228 (-) Transcript_10113:143-826(-)